MPLLFVRDRDSLSVDAIVQASHTELVMGKSLLTAKVHFPAKYVIHAAYPENLNNEPLLYESFLSGLKSALDAECSSVAFPFVSNDYYEALSPVVIQVAIDAVQRFLAENELTVYFVIDEKETSHITPKTQLRVKDYLSEHFQLQKEVKAAPEKRDRQSPFKGGGSLLFSIDEKQFWPEEFKKERLKKAGDKKVSKVAKEVIKEDLPDQELFKELLDKLNSAKSAPSHREKHKIAENIEKSAPAAKIVPLTGLSQEKALLLKEQLQHLDESFFDALIHLIRQKNRKESEIYKKANVDRKFFSKMRNKKKYIPKKNICLAFAIALELDMKETTELLKRAGYAFSNSSIFDVIIEFFIQANEYDVIEINKVLFHYDQPLLGATKKE